MSPRAVLAYHAVVPDGTPVDDPCFHRASTFRRQLRLLKQHATIVPLDELIRATDTSGRVLVALTLDDGFRNNHDVVLPILIEERVPATVFLATDFIGTDDTIWFCRLAAAFGATHRPRLDWEGESYDLAPRRRLDSSVRLQGRLKRLPHPELLDQVRRIVRVLGGDVDMPIDPASPYRMLDEAAIHAMARTGLVSFGAHGARHAILARLDPSSQDADIRDATAAVRGITGAACTQFAYPNGRPGDFDATTTEALRRHGITHSFTTSPGLLGDDDDPLRLPRFGISSVDEWHDFPETLRSLGLHRPGTLPGARILFAYRFCGNGGVETALLNRARALRDAGSAVEVMFDEFYGVGGPEMADDPAVMVGLDRDTRLAHLRRRAHDVISIVDHPASLGIVAAVNTTGAVFVETHASAPAALPRLYEHFRSPLVSAVLVPAQFNRTMIEAVAGPGIPVEVVPNALAFDTWADHGQLQPSEAGAVPLAWIGRLEDEKNPVEFLHLVAHLLASGIAVDAIVVGDTWNHAEYHAALLENIDPAVAARVTFRRAVAYTEMPALYHDVARRGGCLVSTSRHESQPMVFLEAMAAGCPVVSNDVGGVRELIEQAVTGWLYPLGDIVRAAQAVAEATGHGAMRQLVITNARHQTASRHGGDAVAARFAEVIATHPPRVRREPLVSAVMIVRDGERFIGEAIDSVLAQHYRHWELIIVDDGSRDATPSIVRRYAEGDPRIRIAGHAGGGNRGKSVSRNTGFGLARGEYVAMLDHDDVWKPNKLAEQVAIMEAHPAAGAIFGRTTYWHSWSGNPDDRDRDGESRLGVAPDTVVPPPELVLGILADERTIPSPCSVLVRRALIDEVSGFDERFTDIYDDVVFFVKLFLRAPVFVSGSNWDFYRQHADNSTARAFRSGFWHPGRPNPARRRLLEWIEAHVAGIAEPAVHDAVRRELAPYREPGTRTAREQLLDAILDASLSALRGEAPPDAPLPAVSDGADAPDAAQVAERLLEGLPPVTDHSRSPWLDHWPRVASRLEGFLAGLEAALQRPGLAAAVLLMCERMIHRRWTLRVGDHCAASLMLRDGDDDPMRVVIDALPEGAPSYDVQLNRHGVAVERGRAYQLQGWMRAPTARAVGIGIAETRDPWANLGLYREVMVGPEWAEFRFEWVAADVDAARIHVDLGGSPIPVELRGVELRPA